MGETPLKIAAYEPLKISSFEPAQTPDQPGGVSHFASEFWKRANPMGWAEGLVEAAKHPLDTATNLVRADPKFLDDAKEAAHKGDYLTAGRKVLSYLSMGLGHELDTQADMGAKGDISGMTGAMAGTATQFLAPEAASAGLSKVAGATLRGARPANPAIADAVAAGRAAGVPIDAASATDNAAVRAVQHLSDRSLGGAQIAGRAAQRQVEGLATMGEQLAAKGHPSPVTAEQAGAAVRGAVDTRIGDLGAAADASYGKLRAIEAQRPIPVDLAPVKAALEPMYATLAKGADIAPLQGSKATAVRAMARILEGPDIADASVVDSALSDLKALQRDAAGTSGAAAANQAVAAVHDAVLGAVTKAGPDALRALNEGRTATTAKYVAQDVLDSLHAEPVKATQGLTARADTAVEKLRAVAREAPQTLPQIGRSVLDGFLDTATEGGGFAHADKLYADWQKLGPETKKLIFKDDAYIQDLDNFFTLAKHIQKNANPSGTAHAVAMLAQGSQLWNPLHFAATVAGTAGLSAFLHSSVGVKLLTEGFKLPASQVARASWMAKMQKFGVAQGAVLASQPAARGPGG